MKALTKAEEEIMNGFWEYAPCTVTQLIDQKYVDPKPPHSSISTITRILEKKGFLKHVAYGRTHVYSPTIDKATYTEQTLQEVKKKYFAGSAMDMLSFFVKKEDLKLEDVIEIMKKIEKS